jgi:hypothetical protein
MPRTLKLKSLNRISGSSFLVSGSLLPDSEFLVPRIVPHPQKYGRVFGWTDSASSFFIQSACFSGVRGQGSGDRKQETGDGRHLPIRVAGVVLACPLQME